MEMKEEIIVGTNEEFILSYKLQKNEEGKLDFVASFTNRSHTGGIRQVASSGKYMASGGTDERIRIFNLSKRKEEGLLIDHEGTVQCLQFHGTSHLFSAGEDNKICIFKTGSWVCEKTLQGHEAPVNSIAVHPSGKLAISVCKNKKLITWNLIKGRRAFITNIKTVADQVYWSPDGLLYLVVVQSKIDVYDISTAKITQTVDFRETIHSILFLKDNILAVGGEGKNICFYNLKDQKDILQFEAHENRIKSLVLFKDGEDDIKFCSSSSDGFIKIWSIKNEEFNTKPELLGEVNTSCRISCMTVFYPPPSTLKERKEKLNKKQLELSNEISNKEEVVQQNNTAKRKLGELKKPKKKVKLLLT